MDHLKQLEKFVNSSDKVLTFPSYLSSNERYNIHHLCETVYKNQLVSHTLGSDEDKFIVVRKYDADNENNQNSSNNYAKNKYTTQILQTFSQYFEFPITIYEEPYFSYFVELYDGDYNIKNNLLLLDEVLDRCKNEKTTYSELHNKIKNDIIAAMKNNRNNHAVSKKIEIGKKYNFPKLNLYSVTSQNAESFPKYYISIDIIKANFNATKLEMPELVLGVESWEDFVRKFTDLEYFIQSKYFRQVIFGHFDNKKMQAISKNILYMLIDQIDLNLYKVFGCNYDEFAIESSNETFVDDYKYVLERIQELPPNIQKILRVEPIKINPIGSTNSFVRQIYDLSAPDLKLVSTKYKRIQKKYFAQFYKFHNSLELHEYDLLVPNGNMVTKLPYPIIPELYLEWEKSKQD